MNPEILRPTTLDEIIGLDHIKQILNYEVVGAQLLNEKPSHIILEGPPGSGKTTVCAVLANIMGGTAHRYLAADLKSPEAVYEMAQSIKDNDTVLLEEAHTMSRKVESVFLPWFESGELLGGGQYGVINAPKCVFVLATTSSGLISPALRSRCKLLSTSYYSIDDIKTIITNAARKLNVDVTNREALTLLAQSSRGTPRTALMNRLDPLRKMMAVDHTEFDLESVNNFFKVHKVSPWGLENNDLIYCKALYEKMEVGNGKPVSTRTIAQTTGFAEDIILSVIEPYLNQIGVIRIDTRGRSFTEQGYELLGYNPIVPKLVYGIKSNAINMEELKVLLENPSIRQAGMRAVAQHFGLKYGPDNYLIKEALEKLGYTAVQRIGIIKL